MIDKSMPGMGASALAAQRAAMQNAPTELRAGEPVSPPPPEPAPAASSAAPPAPSPAPAAEPPASPAPAAERATDATKLLEPEAVSSEELIQSLQMTMDVAEDPAAAITAALPEPKSPAPPDLSTEKLDFNNLSF